tara:strand:- start:79 stop:705 length:627 start_codon:yes stop_codon:yes gene_type:complete
MIKHIVALLFSFIIIGASGQTLKQATKVLKKVNSLEEFETLKGKYPDWNITVDKTILSDSSDFPEIVKAKKGDILRKQWHSNTPTFAMKVMKMDSTELCKVKYIVFSGREYSRAKIDSIRKVILSKYEAGESFESLAAQYHTDGNKTGDLQWFPKGRMVEEFDSAVWNRAKGEIFTVDVERNMWYYVVLKTHDNKMEKTVVSIRIQYI